MNSIVDMNRIESEVGLIATLIYHPDFVFDSEHLLHSHFTSVDHALTYKAISGLAHNGIKTVDPYNIREYLRCNDPEGFKVLSIEKLKEFVEASKFLARSTIQEYEQLADNILDAAFRREMYSKLGECQNLCLRQEERDVLPRIYNIVDSVMSDFSYNDGLEQYVEHVDDYWNQIQERQGTGYAGIPFKFPALNDYVTIERGELVIFGAQQKVGKSIMLLNCAVDLLEHGYSVLYIDSELSSRLFTARLLSHLSHVKYRDLTSGMYNIEQEKAILEAKEWIKSKPFNHIYMPFFDSDSIYRTVKKVNHTQPIDVLIIDYFKSMGNEVGAYETYAAMGKCVDLVKNELAGAMNIAAIGAAQATVNNKLADSAKIARNASTIVMLMDKTPEEIETDGKECGNKKMVVTINRNGMQHGQDEYIDLVFDGDYISYEQAPSQHRPKLPY